MYLAGSVDPNKSFISAFHALKEEYFKATNLFFYKFYNLLQPYMHLLNPACTYCYSSDCKTRSCNMATWNKT